MDELEYDKAHFFLTPELKVVFIIKPEDGQQQAGQYLFFLDIFDEEEALDACGMLQIAVDTVLVMLDAKRIDLELKNISKNGRNN
jgi:hypothetical protein